MSLRKQATSGIMWTFSQQFGSQLISFLISVVLARLLEPEDFGLIGMIAIFMSIGKTLMDSGLTSSLIRSKDPDDADFSTVFYFNLAISTLIYIIIFFSAPLIAGFYEKPILTDIVRVYCVTFIIQAFSAVQRCRFTIDLNFKTQMLIDIPSNILSGAIGIGMAYNGFGVWSLVFSGISGFLLSTIQVWIYSKWRPKLIFSLSKFKEHFNFGYKLTLTSLLNKIFDNIYLIVIGKYFAPAMVGFYTRADTMKQLPVRNISSALNKVTYPLFSKIKEDSMRLKDVYKRLMQVVIFVIAPTLMLAIVLGEPIFSFLFGEKWLPAVPYFQILCVVGIIYPINSYNLNILKVKGRSELILKLEVIKKVIIGISILIFVQFGIYALLFSQVFISILSFFINSHYSGKFINYSSIEQIKDFSPILLISTICSLGSYFILINLSLHFSFLKILIIGLIGVTSFIFLAWLFKISALKELLSLIENRK